MGQLYRDQDVLLEQVIHWTDMSVGRVVRTGYTLDCTRQWVGTQERITEYRRGKSLGDKKHYGRLELSIR